MCVGVSKNGSAHPGLSVTRNESRDHPRQPGQEHDNTSHLTCSLLWDVPSVGRQPTVWVLLGCLVGRQSAESEKAGELLLLNSLFSNWEA